MEISKFHLQINNLRENDELFEIREQIAKISGEAVKYKEVQQQMETISSKQVSYNARISSLENKQSSLTLKSLINEKCLNQEQRFNAKFDKMVVSNKDLEH